MAVPNDKKLTRKPTGWYIGCGCGSKPGDLVTPPDGSVEGLVRVRLSYTGTVSGLLYELEPALVAIDIDPRDVSVLKELGHIVDPPTNQTFKGYLARKAQ